MKITQDPVDNGYERKGGVTTLDERCRQCGAHAYAAKEVGLVVQVGLRMVGRQASRHVGERRMNMGGEDKAPEAKAQERRFLNK